MRHSISPYPDNVKVNGPNVFVAGKYVGYVDDINDGMGNTKLSRPVRGDNSFRRNKTEAVLYLVECAEQI